MSVEKLLNKFQFDARLILRCKYGIKEVPSGRKTYRMDHRREKRKVDNREISKESRVSISEKKNVDERKACAPDLPIFEGKCHEVIIVKKR